MKKKLLTILFITFLTLPNISFGAADDLTEFTNAINDAQKEFKDLKTGNTSEAKIIDDAIKEIDKATEFAKAALENNNTKDAIKALKFIEKSLSDVSNIIPQEFTSDMSNADMSTVKAEDMKEITNLSADIKSKKEKDLNTLISNMMDLSDKGLDSFEISNNLNELGIDTIKVDLRLKNRKEMENWTKEQWADSYKGSILTSTGTEVITDQEIETKVADLEKTLQKNNLTIAKKRSSLLQLESKINPLNLQINQLKAQKDSLTFQYNEKLLTQASKALGDVEINESKTLADNFNKELTSLSDKINRIETQSSKLHTDVAVLNLQLTSDAATSNQLSSQINLLNGQFSDNQRFISMKEVELDQLKKSSPNIKANTDALNQQLVNASLQRDFIQTQFERSIDKEVEHLKVYGRVLGDTEAEMEFSLREVGVILDSDPRRARAFELEKYGTFAGLSPDAIQKGITAIHNDDWGVQKELYKEVITKLSKNPNWVVDVPSNAELNVMIAEEQALQNAIFVAMEGQKIKQKVDAIINDKTKNLTELANLNTTTLQYAATWEGMPEHGYLTKEYNNIIKNSELENLNKTVQEGNQWLAQANETFTRLRQSGRGSDITQGLLSQYSKKYYEVINAQQSALVMQQNASSQARKNIIDAVEKANNTIEEIRQQEITIADGYNYVDKVKEILGKVPTFSEDLQRIDQKDKWNNAFVFTPSIYDDPAALRAAMEGANDLEAYEAARDAMQKIGEVPASQYMTGPYWEMSNVKVAAIVRSKKYDYVDDYAYLNAYYEDPINLTSAETAEAEEELSRILGKDNPRLNALNKEIANLSNEIKNTNSQSININQDIAKLENELKSLETSEKQLQSQITDLTKEFSSKENLIVQNKTKLTDFQKQLDPINSQIKGLETNKAELNIQLEQQLNTIADQIKSKGQATAESDQLKKQFESQIANIDDQLKQFEKESENITVSVASINKELNSLEVETPELSKQISSLNEDIKDFINVKADLAITSAKKHTISIESEVIETIAKLDNKSIVSIDGTTTFRVVDTNLLIDQKGQFKVPDGTVTVNGEVFTAGAVQPEKLFSFSAIDEQGDFKVKYSKEAAKQIQATGTLVGGKQTYNENTLGSWVLVDAKTGKQMDSAINGYRGSTICTGAICGSEGVFGKQAALIGGMYVLENLADAETGRIIGKCNGGDCQFNLADMSLTGISGGVSDIAKDAQAVADINKRVVSAQVSLARAVTLATRGVTQKALTTTGATSSSSLAVTTVAKEGFGLKEGDITVGEYVDQKGRVLQGITQFSGKTPSMSVVDDVLGSNYGKDSSLYGTGHYSRMATRMSARLANSQAAAAKVAADAAAHSLAGASSSTTSSVAAAVAGQVASDMMSLATMQVNSSSEALRAAQAASAAAVDEVQKAAAEAQVAAVQAVNAAANEALAAAQEATQAVRTAAAQAQQAAGDVVAGIDGNDLAALSQLANDARGVWVQVDAQGRAVDSDKALYGSGRSVCTASECGPGSDRAKALAARGEHYVRENR